MSLASPLTQDSVEEALSCEDLDFDLDLPEEAKQRLMLEPALNKERCSSAVRSSRDLLRSWQ